MLSKHVFYLKITFVLKNQSHYSGVRGQRVKCLFHNGDKSYGRIKAHGVRYCLFYVSTSRGQKIRVLDEQFTNVFIFGLVVGRMWAKK